MKGRMHLTFSVLKFDIYCVESNRANVNGNFE